MAEKKFADKEKETITISRGKHNRENPYVMISKKMIRDPSISPKAKGVLVFLLSLPDGWITHPRSLAKEMGIGKDQIYSILKELMKAGYAIRGENKSEKGRFKAVNYFFFEEKQEISSEIQIKSTVSGNPDTEKPCPGFPDTEIQTLIINNLTEDIEKEHTSLKVSPQKEAATADMPDKSGEERSSFSSDVQEIGKELVKIVKETKPDWKAPKSLAQVYVAVDLMLRVDNREAKKIIRVFRWALADAFWADKFYKPNPAKYLREKFDQLDAKMNAKLPENPHKVDRRWRDKDGNVTTDEFKYDLF